MNQLRNILDEVEVNAKLAERFRFCLAWGWPEATPRCDVIKGMPKLSNCFAHPPTTAPKAFSRESAMPC